MNDLILRLGVALAIGLLVGLERGWRERDEPSGSRTAGLRTFGIFGLLGGLFAAISQAMAAPIVFAAGFAGFSVLYGLFQFQKSEHDETYSITGLVAGLAVFALGALAVVDDARAAAAAGTALAALLASREVMHQALRKLNWIEIRSAFTLAVMTTIILPLLPNRALDPWGGFNPWEIWLFTVLIATISFVGYIAVRVLGPRRGLLVSGLAGALASSTAVTVALARMARGDRDRLPLAGTALLAGAVSVLRVTAVVALLQPGLLALMAPPALATAAVLVLSGGLMLFLGPAAVEGADGVRNPFELRALALFAALFAFVSMASAILVSYFGDTSLLASAAISGSLDVDVAVLSSLRMIGRGIALPLVAAAVLAAVASNACARILLAVLAGPPAFWLPLAAATFSAVAAGAGAFYLIAFA
ncbi:DUF4010 domain-containing protein [Cereibacter sphaeroides]|uniref:MgtC/SapB family protein n=1 Tax=Cereibacter sphaeroides TaxID=1063 RepID=UPI001F186B0E|nr:MgtC/SapB family protein [Cereibacter sphaeroides]MCE6958574.1 DUF4010 domain-containing protein [Cereibacter sphaeroides]MCE6968993.1 DUF4010 domain-containing protein [Cereibacter sphaeroides]MCE6972383.1 DUF4010 domain-containing protein [Cereibacter sphaeroides]